MKTPSYEALKRAFDLTAATTGLVVLSPALVGVALLIRVRIGSPVLFRQVRPGRDERPFTLYKFRTMTDARDATDKPLPDGLRLTPLGRFLRRTSIDELPELINVLRGEMSLVGPRPLLVRYLPHFTETERARFTVPPGITGWAQIHGRNEASWDERLGRDVWYVQHRSLGLDLEILLRTLTKVFTSSGVVVDACSIMQNLDEERSMGKS